MGRAYDSWVLTLLVRHVTNEIRNLQCKSCPTSFVNWEYALQVKVSGLLVRQQFELGVSCLGTIGGILGEKKKDLLT